MDEILILKKVEWAEHVHKLILATNKLKVKVLKCNIERSIFGQTEMEY